MRHRLVLAVLPLLMLEIGSASAEEAYRWYQTTQSVQGWWHTDGSDAWGSLSISVQDGVSGYWAWFSDYGFDGVTYFDRWCYFYEEGVFVVDAEGTKLKNAVLTLDSTQDGVFCSEPMQAHIVLTPTPDTWGLLHGNGTEKIQGHEVITQTMRRFWGVNAAGSVGDFQLPPFPQMGVARLEVEDWYSMTK